MSVLWESTDVVCPACGRKMTRSYYDSRHKLECLPREIETNMFSAQIEYVQSGLEAMIKDEEKGVKEYTDLSRILETMKWNNEANLIKNIANDEAKHLELLKKIQSTKKIL